MVFFSLFISAACKCRTTLYFRLTYFPVHVSGAISAASTLGPPGKPPQLEDSYSPYNLMSSSESPTSPLVAPDSWGQGKNPNEKISNGTNINWPPGENHLQGDTVSEFASRVKLLPA